VLDIDLSSPTFGSILSVFNYRSAVPALKLLDGPPHGRELSEIALSPVDRNVVLLNVKRTNLVVYNIASRMAKLIDVKCLNVTSKTFLFGATFSYNGKVITCLTLVFDAGDTCDLTSLWQLSYLLDAILQHFQVWRPCIKITVDTGIENQLKISLTRLISE